MNQEKFVNYYVELLTNTITESVQKNLVLQTEKRVLDQTLKDSTEAFKKRESELENSLRDRQNEVESLRHQLADMRKQKDVVVSQTDELRKNINHLETFKNEILKERKENERLNEEIVKLKSELANAVEKYQEAIQPKLFEPLTIKEVKKKRKENTLETVEDAGSF